jgi:AraC-like DNA-binding protein
MDIKFSFIDILSLIALIMGLLYNFQILTLKNRTNATRYFSFYLFNITFIILFFFLLRMKLDDIVKYVTPLLIFSELIMPISLWIYLKKITSPNKSKRYYKHYLAPIIASSVILLILLIVVFSKNESLNTFLSKFLVTYVLIIMTVGFLLLNVIYLTFSFILIYRHQKIIKNYYSYTQKIDLNWVKLMLFAYIFLLIGLIVSNLSNLEWTDWVFYGVLIVFIVFIGHNALKQREIFNESKVLSTSTKEENDLNKVVFELENEIFSEAQLSLFKELKVKLEELMQDKKPYLDQDLSILKLAKDLNTNTKYLSHIINSEYKHNFINFVNQYRIEEVKNQLISGNLNFTIEALAQNAGFKSKSSFNSAFKKITGKTPSDFIKESKVNS